MLRGAILLVLLTAANSTAAALSAGCPALESLTVNARCSLEGTDVDCGSAPVQPGTIARLACRPGYAPKGNDRDKLITSCGVNRWRPEPIACELDCGRRGGNSRPLRSVGGKEAKRGEFPWHVAVYREDRDSFYYTCGGSLVTRKFFISAATCFWDAKLATLFSKSLYRAILGKHTREWQTQDEHEQRRSVKAVHVPGRFRDRSSSDVANIALVELSAQVELTPAVNVVCLDWKTTFEHRQLVNNSVGVIPGWGVTENNTASSTLRFVELPVLPFIDCLNAVPEGAQDFLYGDKFCTGFANRSTGACPGDLGGGVVFPDGEVGGQRYYLRGVISNYIFLSQSPDRLCPADDINENTKISVYAGWMENIILQQESGEEH